MSLLHDMRCFARRHSLWRPETRVVAAVSGGSDSVAMVLLLHDLHTRGEVRLDAVAHLNHSIRPEAAGDEAFCRSLAARLSTPFLSSTVDVPARARATRRSLEVAGRSARRDFFEQVRATRHADRIATAHTQDDQAETVLLRLLRGAGRKGLGGIAPSRRPYIRPVLFACREELRQTVRSCGEQWREDATNVDRANPRNRVRHELLPYLEQHFTPAARRVLARAADVARADEALLWHETAAASVRVVRRDAGSLRLDREALNALPDAIATRVVLHALLALPLPTSPVRHHVEAVMDVAAGRRSAAEISRWRVEPSGGSVVLVSKALRRPSVAFRRELPIPGEVTLAEAGVAVSAGVPHTLEVAGPERWRLDRDREVGAWSVEPHQVTVAADELGEGLVVRTRRPGDRLRPLGMHGSRKVQDVLVDRKVRRDERDRVPIVTDMSDRIVWVAGHVIGEDFRITNRTKAVIILKLRRV